MKISQEVRDFAKANPRPLAGEGDSAPPALSGESGQAEAEAGMAAMSERYRDEGSELYHRADGLPIPEHH